MPTRSQRHVYEIQGTINGYRPSSGGTAPPSVTSSPTKSVLEGVAFTTPLTASEPVTWIKSGGDAALFGLTGSTLTMISRDYEAPADADHDNVYVCTLTATSIATGLTTVQTFSLSVQDVYEDVTAPAITSPSASTVQENTAFSLALTANEAVSVWAKVGGADQALFTLSGNTLTMSAKDFETPTDADLNNVYVVQVTAKDVANNTSAPYTITVTVTDVSESAAPFTLTDTIAQGTDVTSNPAALSGRSIGLADASRVVLLALQYTQSHQGRSTPFVTCDGVEMMLAACSNRQSGSSAAQIYAIAKPTGTTADFSITFNTTDAGPNVLRYNAFIVAAINMSLVPSDITGASFFTPSTGNNVLTLDAKVDNGGLVLVIAGEDAPSTPLETWVGVTQAQTLVAETLRSSLAQLQPTASQTSRSISFAVNGSGSINVSSSSGCCVALAPAITSRKLVWDTFDRADAALNVSTTPSGFTNSGNWAWDARTPTVNIVSGRLTNNNTNGPGTVYSIDLASPDMWAEWMCDNTSASNGPFVTVRTIDYDNFIGVRAAGGSVEVYKREVSAMSALLNTNFDLAFSVLMRIEAEGNQLRTYRNCELMNTQTIAAPFLTPTKAGIVGRSAVLANFIGKFRCGTL